MIQIISAIHASLKGLLSQVVLKILLFYALWGIFYNKKFIHNKINFELQ